MIVDFTPVPSLLGGLLIGLSASLVLLGQGRVAGISGIWGGLLRPVEGDVGWRATFVAGLLSGAALVVLLAPGLVRAPEGRSLVSVAVAGLLVGVGTRIGNGCTSGHGVCGLSRLSVRSAVSVATFMSVGFLVATGISALFGGG